MLIEAGARVSYCSVVQWSNNGHIFLIKLYFFLSQKISDILCMKFSPATGQNGQDSLKNGFC